jgi:tRNA 5-methylaminomethyl-2-thiouridine biosynthesis bifunctional protein
LPPQLVCEQLLELNDIPLVQADIQSLEYSEEQGNWQLHDTNQQRVIESETVIIASAFDCKQFSQTAYLPLRKIRGQITQLPCTTESRKMKMVICGECYITPAENGLHGCGATYNKDLFTTELRDIDHQTNLAQIAATDAGLAAVLGQPAKNSLTGRANFRCTTSDYLPIAGPVPDRAAMLEDYAILRRDAKTPMTTPGAYLPNLYVNCGMGSRGLSYAPLTAELLAAEIAGETSELDCEPPQELRHSMHPVRFLIRDLKRNRI